MGLLPHAGAAIQGLGAVQPQDYQAAHGHQPNSGQDLPKTAKTKYQFNKSWKQK